MRKAKRLIALLTVALFLLSLAAPASAATKEEAFGRLNALSVAVGDQNGDPQYDKNFTRAEAAAIMVNLSGMKAAIDAAKGPTKFKDVPANHWATGVINLAVGAGIIKGYPDGTYKPDANVTYAEMSAMLVGVLGYTPKLQGTWPSNVIGKAAQLGLLDGVSVTDYNGAAVRSNVFLAADNALDTKPLKETKDGYEEDTKTLMENKLSVTKKPEGYVVTTPNYGEKNRVGVDPTPATAGDDAYSVETLDSVDGNALYGAKVVPWVKDDKVFFFDVKNAADVINDKVVAAKTDATLSNIIYLDGKDKSYNLSADVKYVEDYTETTVLADIKTAIDALADGTAVKVVLDSAGKVAFIEVFTFDRALVKDVDTSNDKINAKVGTSLDLKSATYTIVKNGKAIGIADVKAGDVLDVATDGSDKYYIIVTQKSVSGKVEAVSTDKVTIAGTAYKYVADFKVSTNNGDSYSAALADVQGKDVTAKLNKDGKLAYIVADSAATSNYFPVIVKDIAPDGTIDKNVWIKVGKVDGVNTSYQVTKDTKLDGVKLDNDDVDGLKAAAPNVQKDGVPASALAAGDVVKMELASDGKVKEIKNYTTELIDKTAGTVPISKTNDTLAGYKVNSDSKFCYLNSDGDYKSLSWSGVESLESGDEVAEGMWIIIDKGIIKYVFITDVTTTAGDYIFGYVQTAGSYDAALDSDWSDVYVKGEIKRYKGQQTVEQVVYFKLDDNEITNLGAPAAVDALSAGTTSYILKDINETDKLIAIVKASTPDADATWVPYDAGMTVFKEDELKTLSYAKDKTIELYDVWNDKGELGTDAAFDFIVILP